MKSNKLENSVTYPRLILRLIWKKTYSQIFNKYKVIRAILHRRRCNVLFLYYRITIFAFEVRSYWKNTYLLIFASTGVFALDVWHIENKWFEIFETVLWNFPFHVKGSEIEIRVVAEHYTARFATLYLQLFSFSFHPNVNFISWSFQIDFLERKGRMNAKFAWKWEERGFNLIQR